MEDLFTGGGQSISVKAVLSLNCGCSLRKGGESDSAALEFWRQFAGRIQRAALMVMKNVCFESNLLLGNDRILHAFTDAEFKRGFGWNLDRLTCGRITAFARFALGKYEFAKTR